MNTKLLSSIMILVLFISLLAAAPAFAHGDEPRLEISTDSLNPGDMVEIRGVDFEFEEEIDLSLVGPQSEISLGSVVADAEGIFQFGVTLPTDLVAGDYLIRAKTDDHIVESPRINVWGTAQLGGGEEGLREEEDGLLAPMPTFESVVSTSVPQAPSPSSSIPSQSSDSRLRWIIAIVGVILAAGFIRVIKK